MVVLNNSFSGVNDPATDAYIRNLNDFRVGVELALLPILNYLIAKPKFTIPSALFKKEENYLKFLANRYHKQPLNLVFGENDDKVFRLLISAIEKSRKRVSYSLNDLIDLLHMYEKELTQTQFHKNIVLTTLIACEKFYKKIPSRFDKKINLETSTLKAVAPMYRAKTKFDSPIQLYTQVVFDLFRTIDFELLKLYDFLFEFGYTTIHSSALLEIVDEVIELAQADYAKVGIVYDGKKLKNKKNIISILPYEDGIIQDRMIEEWCSNLRRAIELKLLLKQDLKKLHKTTDDLIVRL